MASEPAKRPRSESPEKPIGDSGPKRQKEAPPTQNLCEYKRAVALGIVNAAGLPEALAPIIWHYASPEYYTLIMTICGIPETTQTYGAGHANADFTVTPNPDGKHTQITVAAIRHRPSSFDLGRCQNEGCKRFATALFTCRRPYDDSIWGPSMTFKVMAYATYPSRDPDPGRLILTINTNMRTFEESVGYTRGRGSRTEYPEFINVWTCGHSVDVRGFDFMFDHNRKEPYVHNM